MAGRRRLTATILICSGALATVAATSAAARPPAAATGVQHAAASPCRAWVHNGHKRTRLAARLSRDIRAALAGRTDIYAVRMKDPHLGVGCGLHAPSHFYSASAVKATILAALLHKAQVTHRSLTQSEKDLAWLMITQSDNAAATALWNDVGPVYLQRFLNAAGMKETLLGPSGYWGLTQITARDETTLLWRLLKPWSGLSKPARRYELRLMANVIPAQRWGVPAGAPSGFTVHVKNGWAPLNSPYWTVNSIGCFTHSDANYSIVVLTQGTASGGSLDYGIVTIEKVATAIHHDLNPAARRLPPFLPPPSWNTPDEPLPPHQP